MTIDVPADAPMRWRLADGSPVACREKLRVLEENHAEISAILQDAFDDAVLMGVAPGAMRAVLCDLVAGLKSPHR